MGQRNPAAPKGWLKPRNSWNKPPINCHRSGVPAGLQCLEQLPRLLHLSPGGVDKLTQTFKSNRLTLNVGQTIINHPQIHHSNRCFFKPNHSQSWVVYGIVLPSFVRSFWIQSSAPSLRSSAKPRHQSHYKSQTCQTATTAGKKLLIPKQNHDNLTTTIRLLLLGYHDSFITTIYVQYVSVYMYIYIYYTVYWYWIWYISAVTV